MTASLLVHATTLALGDRGVLLRGVSGSGKSDLALRFLSDGSVGATRDVRRLVADDQTMLIEDKGRVLASPPARIAGLLEVRGVGLFTVPFVAGVPVCLVVDLVGAGEVERMPPEDETTVLLGCRIPLRKLTPFEASAPLKLALLLRALADVDALPAGLSAASAGST